MTTPTNPTLTLSDAGKRYLRYIRMIPPSHATYRSAFWNINQVVRSIGERPLSEISPSDFLRFQLEIAKRLSHDSVRTSVGYVKAFASWMATEGLTPMDLGGLMRKPRRQKKEIEVLAKDQVKALLGLAREQEVPALAMGVHMLLYCALRVNEACSLRVSDIDLENRTLTVRNGKGGYSARTIPLHRSLVPRLRDYLASRNLPEESYLLADPVEPVKDYTLRRALERLGEGIGITEATPQILRRTLATLLHESGARIEVVSAFLGHSHQSNHGNQVALQHYVKVSIEEMRRMLNKVRV